ncbi:MAG: 23S rRNA (adenine(2503)-C(2))-methyltransferase RlmN [Thermoleophilia bacterium]|nr:23S rRNA (adenine(2503)-C(2))-methyltransferase RlmN [Thermoleophilia bacterium]
MNAAELLRIYRPDIADALAAQEVASYRHAQVLEHLFRRPLAPFAEATALPAQLRAALSELGECVLRAVAMREAPDGTRKVLLETADGASVETVVMMYPDRVTACISTQVGCPVGCAFCATGALGFKRNLSVAEIVDQVRVAAHEAERAGRKLSRLVFMGMGEPLLNLKAVLDSIEVLSNPAGFGLGQRNMSVSTIGIPKGIIRLAERHPQVNLALSLHAADDATRARLIPKPFCHPLGLILEAAWRHFALTRRKLLIEYVLLQGINDSPQDARRLASLLRGRVVTVNLLAWNPATGPRGGALRPLGGRGAAAPFAAPSPQAVAAFRQILIDAGIEAVVRKSKGQEIEAACGQLAGQRKSYLNNMPR